MREKGGRARLFCSCLFLCVVGFVILVSVYLGM